jgi:AcrR family transcriptional regulator
MRDLAAACSVSVPTLRHYFPRQQDLVAAVIAQQGRDGAPHLARMAEPAGDLEASVHGAVREVVAGFRHGVGEVFALGLLEGLREEELGPGFLAHGLDPTLGTVARRLEAHIARGEMRPCDPRQAALSLLAPVLLACLHQMELGGARSAPMPLDDFAEAHAAAFLRGHAASSPRGHAATITPRDGG